MIVSNGRCGEVMSQPKTRKVRSIGLDAIQPGTLVKCQTQVVDVKPNEARSTKPVTSL